MNPLGAWYKSSYTHGSENCVEVNSGRAEALLVRDSKALSRGVLSFPTEAWRSFIDRVRR